MTVLAENLYSSYSLAVGWEIGVFFFLLILFTAYLLWANTRQDDEIEAAIRRASRGHVDPDDLTEALLFERKQARTAKAIKGERE